MIRVYLINVFHLTKHELQLHNIDPSDLSAIQSTKLDNLIKNKRRKKKNNTKREGEEINVLPNREASIEVMWPGLLRDLFELNHWNLK